LVLCQSGSEQFASAVMVVGYYLYTFLVPHPLSCDYSYSTFVPVQLSNLTFLFTFLLCLGGFIYAIKELKNRSIISFGILWFFISFSLASNVFFLIGTGFGERLLFMPSLGLCLLLVALLAKFFLKEKENASVMGAIKSSPVLWGVVLVLSVAYAGKTMSRNNDWRTDYKLFSTDIESYPDATHLLFYMGNHLSGDERKEVLTEELANIGFSEQQITDSIAKESATSINYFRRSLSIFPALPSDGYNQLGKAYFKTGQLDSAFKYYKQALDLDTTNGIFVNNVGTVFYQKQDLNTAMPYFQKAHILDTAEADFMNNIGAVFGQSGMYDSAIYWFYKASVADSMDLTSVKFLEMTYQNLGNTEEANRWRQRKEYVANRRKQLLK
jgi:protein O-mannosyl-transferase